MDGQYEARPEAMRAAVGNVSGILVQAITTLLDLESLLVDPASFAQLGGAVATANTELQGEQIRALRSLLDLLRDTNDSVHRSANDYDEADRNLATSYGGGTSPLWHSTSAADLAGFAVTDSAGSPGTPHSVGTVLDYLARTGMGELAYRPVPADGFADAGGFADWLDADPEHQSRLGVIGVYSGESRGLADVPAIQRGDVVVAGSLGDGQSLIGVAGGDGQLYNHGPVGPDLPYGSRIRVYRPVA
ncbi:hypothetical protein GCM10022220_72810 [Actinocatenispora rupis]|uniref:WXG100 family type VII secretion target n=1 Tax=Actinocatenispora rupis TaxID=519421 RepID=A0A8J3NHE6_9ACTN|nr:hypothetical protein Aru02nite_67580 [Actinocatenispora rupis]